MTGFDPYEAQQDDGLWEKLTALRAKCPVVRTEALGGLWIVTGFDEVARVAQDWETFSSREGVSLDRSPFDVLVPSSLDPPVHAAYRHVMNPAFSPQAVQARVAEIERIAVELVVRLGSGGCEFVSDFARPFPTLVFSKAILKLDDETANRVGTLVDHMILGEDDAMPAFAELGQWILAFLGERSESQTEPCATDFVSRLLHGTVDGRPLSTDHQFQIFLLTLFGGLETTSGALAYAMRHIASRPGLQARLRRDTTALSPAIEEFLRAEPPAPWFARTATRDVEIAGHTIAAGDRVAMCLAGANRDPLVFERPNAIDIDRTGNRHLAFGFGPHRCVGIHLARTEMQIALRTILSHLTTIVIEPDATPEYRAHHARSLTRLPITYERVSSGQ